MNAKKVTSLLASLILPVVCAIGGESPMLKKMVDEGKLPPLEERLPENPLVENPVSEVGKYGGKLVLGTAFFLDDEPSYSNFLPEFQLDPLL